MKRFPDVGLLFFFSLLVIALSSGNAYASHYRAGKLSVAARTGRTVTFELEAEFRRGFGSWCPKAPATCLGKTITGLKDLLFGDGNKVAVTAKVVKDDPTRDIVILRQTFVHTYAAPGNYNASWSGCCWLKNESNVTNWTLRVVAQVGNSNQSPVVKAPSLFLWCEKVPFRASLQASDPDGDPLQYKLLRGPSGLALDKQGILAWAVPSKGLWPIEVEVSDNKGAKIQRQLMIELRAPCNNALPALVLTPTQSSIKPGERACTTATASDSDAAQQLSWSVVGPGAVSGLPSGAQKSPSKATICWQSSLQDEGKVRPFALRVTDNGAVPLYLEKPWEITVRKGLPPVLTLTPAGGALTVKEGATLTIAAKSSDPDKNGVKSTTVSGLPPFCKATSPNPATLSVTCKPDFLVGNKTFALQFQTTDKDGLPKTTTKSISVSVQNVNRTPRLSLSATTLTLPENGTLSVTATATDEDGDTLTLRTSPLPRGMTWKVTGSVGTLRWTPDTTQSGRYQITVEASDNGSPSRKVSKVLSITVTNVNLPPTILSSPPLTATEDQRYTYTPRASDPDKGDTLTWSPGLAPAGVTLQPTTGQLTWTPGDKEAGKTITLSILVCDAGKLCAQQKWNVTVKNINDAPRITSTPGKNVKERGVYTYSPIALDPDPNERLRWSLTRSPAGARVDAANGKVTWTAGLPGQNGVFALRVCDKSNACVTQTWKVTVIDVNEAPKITSQPPTVASENKTYLYAPRALDPDVADQGKLRWTLQRGPSGATLDPTTGRLSWPPGLAAVKTGTVNFSLQVCDPGGLCDTQIWTTRVLNVNDAPVITTRPSIVAYVGVRYRYVPIATDKDGDKLTWTLKKSPPGVQFDPNSGAVTWTPARADAGKQIDMELRVCDNGQPPLCASQTLNIRVRQRCLYDVDCPRDQICKEELGERLCVDPACDTNTPCPKDKVCRDGQCVTTACMKNPCPGGSVCRATDGKCIQACAGVSCASGQYCQDGSCVKDPCAGKCAPSEICDTSRPGAPTCLSRPCLTNSCKPGRICPSRGTGPCTDDPCLSMQCPGSNQRCLAGQCVERPPCVIDIDCPATQICRKGRCALPGCYATKNACKQGELCFDGVCVTNRCLTQTCPTGQFCRPTDGACVAVCAGISCAPGEFCASSACKKEPCAGVTCKAGKRCFLGTCEYSRCNASKTCRYGRSCNFRANRCVDDPCRGVQCPDEKHLCRNGECVAPGACTFDKDCPGALLCQKGSCVSPRCVKPTDCMGGMLCESGQCRENPCAGKTCPQGQFCRQGQCIRSCAGVFCKKGSACVDGTCLPDACAGLTCKAGERCVNGRCLNDPCKPSFCKAGRACLPKGCVTSPCAGVNCPKGQSCKDGLCVGKLACKVDRDCPGKSVCLQEFCAPPGCYDTGCKPGEICQKGTCRPNQCAQKSCEEGSFCRPSDQTCVRSCPTCKQGRRCVNGLCESDPCTGIQCNPGERCVEGACRPDRCVNSSLVLCKASRVCQNNRCQDDPCDGVQCSGAQVCRAGVCVRPPDPKKEAGKESPAEQTRDAGTLEPRPEIVYEIPTLPTDSGCGCSIMNPAGPLSLFFLLFPLLVRRRR